jgi:hypothetical protein
MSDGYGRARRDRLTTEGLDGYYERYLTREAESPANQFENRAVREVLDLRDENARLKAALARVLDAPAHEPSEYPCDCEWEQSQAAARAALAAKEDA